MHYLPQSLEYLQKTLPQWSFSEFLAHCVLLLWSTTFILSSNDISTWFLWQLIWERECRRKTVVVFYPVTLWTLLWLYQYPVRREKYGKKSNLIYRQFYINQVTISIYVVNLYFLFRGIFLKNLNKVFHFLLLNPKENFCLMPFHRIAFFLKNKNFLSPFGLVQAFFRF